MHFGYPGRRSTAGNLGFPISPSEISYRDRERNYVSTIIAGSRDPFFQKALPQIDREVRDILHRDYPELQAECETAVHIATRDNPYLFLDTLGSSVEEAEAAHDKGMRDLESFVDIDTSPAVKVYAGGFYVWEIFHRLTDLELINQHMFPISLYQADRGDWKFRDVCHATLQSLGDTDYSGSLHYSKLSALHTVKHTDKPIGKKALSDMAHVIRSKNAGINKISYDLFFNTKQDYTVALQSGCFAPEQIAGTLDIPIERVIGCYRSDACMALKISTHREVLSGSPGDRDLFGAQQHTKLLDMAIPLYESEDYVKDIY
jgi:hypothetical protein